MIEIKKQISASPELRHIADNIDVRGIVVDDVPLDEKGKPMILSRFEDKFLRKL